MKLRSVCPRFVPVRPCDPLCVLFYVQIAVVEGVDPSSVDGLGDGTSVYDVAPDEYIAGERARKLDREVICY